MIQVTEDFIKYFDSIRRRTLNYFRLAPPDRLDWAPKEGEFTCADIIRHFSISERMFIRVAMEGCWKYEGHETEEKQSLDELMTLLETSHTEAMQTLKQFPDPDLNAKQSKQLNKKVFRQ